MNVHSAEYRCSWPDLPAETRGRLIVTGWAAVDAYLYAVVPDQGTPVSVYADGLSSTTYESEVEVRLMLANQSFVFPEGDDSAGSVNVTVEEPPESTPVRGMRVAVPEVTLEDCALSNPRLFTQRLKHETEFRAFGKEHARELVERHLALAE